MKKKIKCYLRMRKHVKFLKRQIHLIGSEIHRDMIDLYRYQDINPHDDEHIVQLQTRINVLKRLHNSRLRRYELLTLFKSAS